MSTSNTWQRSSVTTQTKIKHLVVGTPQGAAGDLFKEARYAFNYSAHEPQCEISLTMPVRAESYASGALLPIFEMNRPEGYLLHKIEEAFAKAGGLDDMRLLDIVGGEQIGRLRYSRPQERRVPRPVRSDWRSSSNANPRRSCLIFSSRPTSNPASPAFSRRS